MKIVVISCPDTTDNEAVYLDKIFRSGLTVFHLRKPGYNRNQIIEYLKKIDPDYYPRIVIHSLYQLADEFNLGGIHITGKNRNEFYRLINTYKDNRNTGQKKSISISCHSLGELMERKKGVDYSFLSPVFDSISKSNYKRKFAFDELHETLSKTRHRVVALGGCRAEYLHEIRELGFSGAAFLGAIWNMPDPFKGFISIKEIADRL